MNFKEFGTENNKIIVLVHGIGITWKMFLPIIEVLKDDYHLVVPVLDGHDEEEDSVFNTIQEETEKIIRYLKNTYGNKIYSIYGVSLGGAITACILEKNELNFEYAIIDAGPIWPINEWMLKLSIKLKVNQIMSLKDENSTYRKLFNKTFYPPVMIEEVCRLAQIIKKETMVNAYNSVFRYQLKTFNFNGKLAYWYGTKESFLCKKYARHIKSLHADTIVKILTNYDHGELAIGNPQKCAEEIQSFITNSTDSLR